VDETILQPGILDQLQDAVFTTDLHGVITSCNQGVSRYGFAAQELVGRKMADLYGVGQATLLATALASVLQKGRFEGEFRCRP
jgi:PAS domain S-box-containing protein